MKSALEGARSYSFIPITYASSASAMSTARSRNCCWIVDKSWGSVTVFHFASPGLQLDALGGSPILPGLISPSMVRNSRVRIRSRPCRVLGAGKTQPVSRHG
jgi:hypothetical protein